MRTNADQTHVIMVANARTSGATSAARVNVHILDTPVSIVSVLSLPLNFCLLLVFGQSLFNVAHKSVVLL